MIRRAHFRLGRRASRSNTLLVSGLALKTSPRLREAAFEQSSDEDSITSKGNGDESNTDKGSGDEGSVVEVNELKLKPSQYGANTPTPTQGRSSSFQLTGVWQVV